MKTETKEKEQVLLCPSVPMHEGALLLGTVGADGIIEYMPERVEVTPEFLAAAAKGSQPPTERFRFSSPCVEKECGNWNGRQCIVPYVVRQYVQITMPEELLARAEPCSIRPQCRWFSQESYNACEVCPILRTKPFLGNEELVRYTHEYRQVK